MIKFPIDRTQGPIAEYGADVWRRALEPEGGNAAPARFWLDLAAQVRAEFNQPGHKFRSAEEARMRMAVSGAVKRAGDAGADERGRLAAVTGATIATRMGWDEGQKTQVAVEELAALERKAGHRATLTP